MSISLKAKLFLSHIGAVLLVSIILGTTGYKYFSQHLLSTESIQLKHSAKHAAELIENSLDDLSTELIRLSDSRVVLDYLSNYRDQALREYLAPYQDKFAKISLLNKAGEEEFKLLEGVPAEKVKKTHSPDLIARLTEYPNEVIIFASGTDPDLKIPTIRMAIARSHYFGNKFAALVSVSVPYAFLVQKINSESMDSTGFIILSDSKQNSLSVFPSGINDKKHTVKYNKSAEPFSFAAVGTSRDDRLKQRLINGVDSLIYATRVKGVDLNIQAVIPYTTIRAKLGTIQNTILICLIAILLLTALLSYFIARQITTPITSLIQFARKMAKGQKAEILDIDFGQGNELTELVDSFQKMLTAISQSTVSRDYLDNIIASMNEIILVVNEREHITTINKSAAHLFSVSSENRGTLTLSDIFTGKNLQFVREMIQEGVSLREMTLNHTKEKRRHLLFSVTPIPSHTNGSKEFVLVATNISYLKEVENELAEKQTYLTSVMQSMPAGLMVVEADSHIIIDVNPTACGMFGFPKEEIIGRVCHRFICPTEKGQCPVTDLSKTVSATERKILTQDGKIIPVLKSVEKVRVGGKELLVESFIDISSRKEMEEALKQSQMKLTELAITDELTGLYNRRGFMALAQKQLQIVKRTKKEVFLLYADLDNMKGINDELGHHNGDLALQDTAMILKRFCRESDIISRIGGDEFAVLLTGSDNENAIVERLDQEIQTFNDNSERPYTISISIGVTSCHPDNKTCEISQFMSQADTLMYEAKKAKQGALPS